MKEGLDSTVLGTHHAVKAALAPHGILNHGGLLGGVGSSPSDRRDFAGSTGGRRVRQSRPDSG
ncbi:hypothetical protein ACIRP2_20445 [Streptomyces sp. NPDC101194]|uniref:hypothetical protein n=1 Tax=Streptomyces sp. NPDC101194 TaxID=3366127 RepID=UPI0037F80925